jgi:four helix bundle protein
MTPAELKQRTKTFTLRVMRLVDVLPTTIQGRNVADQLMRASSSVAANYRAVCRARSRKEFVAKLGIVIEEADEAAFWLELVVDGELVKAALVQSLLQEANEIVAIMTAARKTAIRNKS